MLVKTGFVVPHKGQGNGDVIVYEIHGTALEDWINDVLPEHEFSYTSRCFRDAHLKRSGRFHFVSNGKCLKRSPRPRYPPKSPNKCSRVPTAPASKPRVDECSNKLGANASEKRGSQEEHTVECDNVPIASRPHKRICSSGMIEGPCKAVFKQIKTDTAILFPNLLPPGTDFQNLHLQDEHAAIKSVTSDIGLVQPNNESDSMTPESDIPTHDKAAPTYEEILEQFNKDEQIKRKKELQEEMELAHALDFTRRVEGKRPCRGSGDPTIEISMNKKQFESRDRSTVVHLLERWQYSDPMKTRAKKKKIAEAACRLVAYDSGFIKPPKATNVDAYVKAFEASHDIETNHQTTDRKSCLPS